MATNSDDLVEFEENFNVQLALETLGGSNIRLGNSVTAISLIDKNGKVIIAVMSLLSSHLVVVAEFTISSVASVAEGDPSFSVCSILMMASSETTLAVEVTVSLFTVDGTGNQVLLFEAQLGRQGLLYHTATSGSGDYEPLAAPVTFPAGSADGAEMCAYVILNSDYLVESEEYFTAKLTLVTSGTSFTLGNTTSTIALIDSDGISFGIKLLFV